MRFLTCNIPVFLVILLSCQGKSPTPVVPLPATKDISVNTDSIQQDSIWRATNREEIRDSIRVAKITETAISKVRGFKNQTTVEFECDSFHFQKGHLLNPNDIHLLLHVLDKDHYFGRYSIFLLEGETWKNVLDVETDITTHGVIFKYVNGDAQKDFVLEGYAMAGSGEKYFNRVYLYNPHNPHFDLIEGLGMNPHFYPKKKIVTCYYNPAGVWSAEKYKLNWNKLEIIEEIEIDLHEVIKNDGNLDGIRKIYRYSNGKKTLYKKDRICEFPPEYKPYRELIKPENQE